MSSGEGPGRMFEPREREGRISRRELVERGALATFLFGGGPLLLAACGEDEEGSGGGSAGNGTTTIKFAHVSPAESFHHKTAEKFAELVEAKSSGALKVQLFPTGQLGSEDQYLAGMRSGTPQMGFSSAILSEFYPKWGLVDYPYNFESTEDAIRVMDGPVGDEMRKGAVPTGFRVFGSLFTAPRHVATTKKKVSGVADMKGLKIRTPKTPVYVATFNSWGATPTPLDPAETYTGLQTGVLDGVEQPFDFLYTFKWYQQTKFVALTSHMFTSTTFVAGEKWFSALPDDQQKVIEDSITEALDFGRPMATAEIDKYRKLEEDAGITFTEVDVEEFRAPAQKAVDALAADIDAADLLTRIREA